MNTAYQKVSWTFNYIILFIIAGILIVITLIGWIVFGKQLRQYFTLRKLEKNHLAFLERFNRAVDQVKANASPVKTEEVVSLWKNYMEILIGRPFTKYTSKEILTYEHDEKLAIALRATDRIIYSSLTEFSETSFAILLAYAESHYRKKMEEVKNG